MPNKLTVEQVKRKLAYWQNRQDTEDVRYRIRSLVIDAAESRIQLQCPHPKEYRKFYPGKVGNRIGIHFCSLCNFQFTPEFEKMTRNIATFRLAPRHKKGDS